MRVAALALCVLSMAAGDSLAVPPPAEAQTLSAMYYAVSGTVTLKGDRSCLWPDTPDTFSVYNLDVEFQGVCVEQVSDTGSSYTMRVRHYFAPGTNPLDFKPSGLRVRASLNLSGAYLSLVSDYFESWSTSRSSINVVFSKLSPAIAYDPDAGETGYDPPAEGESVWVSFSAQPPSGTPGFPESLSTERNANFDEVTLIWHLLDKVNEYEIERLEATAVTVGAASRIEYGNLKLFSVAGTTEGVDTFTDTVTPETTYQYRVRAKAEEWSPWSSWVFSGAKSKLDLDAPKNVQVQRERDNSAVTVSWAEPEGAFTDYTVQRQEFVVDGRSSFFANLVSLPSDGTWIDKANLTYRDTAIVSSRTYEYRVAVVNDSVVGDYSPWARSAPVDTTFGAAPANFRLTGAVDRRDRKEFILRWEPVTAADDYEVETGSGGALRSAVVTHPERFTTIWGRSQFRVRGRMTDDALCGAGAYCYTPWAAWLSVPFTPARTIAAPEKPAEAAGAADLRLALEQALNAALDPVGADVNTAYLINFLVLTAGLAAAGTAVYLAHRAGAAPLGGGIGAAMFLMIMWLGIRLVDFPVLWGAVMVAGAPSIIVSLGLVRR